jgi:hypothetical protein
MNVPATCEVWKGIMESGEQQRRVLANIERDPCLDNEVEAAFFERLATQGPPSSPDEAWGSAQEVVRDAPDRFVCQGREVPANRFVTLLRFQRVSSLGYAIPENVRDARGFRDKEFTVDTPEEDLRSFTDEYNGPVNLRNPIQVVWVTEFAAIEALLGNLAEVAGRLGIEVTDRCVLCVYNRGDTGRTLHVPRALDAVNHPQFRVVEDCSADHGWTLPLNRPPDQGLPEAVHRSCSVVPRRWQLAGLP